jgi:hypothetical protein
MYYYYNNYHTNCCNCSRFGISELYPSATNGTEWYSTWNNGHDRTLEFGERDSYDDSFEVSGEVKNRWKYW